VGHRDIDYRFGALLDASGDQRFPPVKDDHFLFGNYRKFILSGCSIIGINVMAIIYKGFFVRENPCMLLLDNRALCPNIDLK